MVPLRFAWLLGKFMPCYTTEQQEGGLVSKCQVWEGALFDIASIISLGFRAL